jgi:inner membrane protein
MFSEQWSWRNPSAPVQPGWRNPRLCRRAEARQAAGRDHLRRLYAAPRIRRVDPLTHSLVGAGLSRAGLHRTTPLATATLVIAANAPDVDVLALVNGSYAGLAFRRGITHGPLALLVLPVLVAALVIAYDRTRRRRAHATAAPARAGPILALAALGVLTHAPLDWMNTYGTRLLLPLDPRWYYGDALFIIDPWIWLMLAAVVVAQTRTRRGWIGWIALGTGATALVLIAPDVPVAAQVVWTIGTAALALQSMRAHWRGARPGERHARVALVAAALYIGAMVLAGRAGRSATAQAARERGLDAAALMVAPAPANPFAAGIVVQTASAYQLGQLRWPGPRVAWSDSILLGPRTNVVIATLQLPQVRDFLRWSRFPYVEVAEDGQGRFVRWGDARYPERMRSGLSGVLVRVEANPREPGSPP